MGMSWRWVRWWKRAPYLTGRGHITDLLRTAVLYDSWSFIATWALFLWDRGTQIGHHGQHRLLQYNRKKNLAQSRYKTGPRLDTYPVNR